jgi:hypothetical protein
MLGAAESKNRLDDHHPVVLDAQRHHRVANEDDRDTQNHNGNRPKPSLRSDRQMNMSCGSRVHLLSPLLCLPVDVVPTFAHLLTYTDCLNNVSCDQCHQDNKQILSLWVV